MKISRVLLCLFPALVVAADTAPVIATEARRGQVFDRIEALGTLRANESVTITANVTETVTDVRFEDNQRVETGDVLVETTSAEENAQLSEALATLDEAERQYNRISELSDTGVASASLLDERKRELDTAKARLAAVQSRLADRLIMAPFAGVVGLRNISPGALVQPGEVITTLDDDSVMKLDFNVPAVYLASLAPGLEIVARSQALPQREFRGAISSIDSRIDPVTRSITVRAKIPNPNRLLRPGLLMTVDIEANPRESVLLDEEAVIQRDRAHLVWVIDRSNDPATVMRREVTIGTRLTGEVEILEGLEPGDLVVAHGVEKMRPGQAVRVQAVDAGSQPLSELLGVNSSMRH